MPDVKCDVLEQRIIPVLLDPGEDVRVVGLTFMQKISASGGCKRFQQAVSID